MYIVKLYKWGEVRNVLRTSDRDKAVETETYLADIYGKDNVWICNLVDEMMVG